MKNFLNILFLSTLVVSIQAQNIDNERMHRDLEVAENALSTIVSPNSNQFPRLGFGEEEIVADYIKDYGVIFMVSISGFSKVKLAKAPDAKNIYLESAENTAVSENDDENHFIEKSKLFLADYAGIIGQLDESQMISIRRGGSGMQYDLEKLYFVKSGNTTSTETVIGTEVRSDADSELIVEVEVAKINALRMGKISREDFLNSVNVIKNEVDYSKDVDLETLSAMFHRLYKKDLSTTYYSESKPKYSKLSNFGIIVRMKFYSSYEDNKIYSMPTISKKGLTLKERNKNVMDLLPKFESEFKENLVNYGRTLKNLDSDEVLLFEINMTTCKDCNDFPKVMKFSIKKSVLHKFNKGKISLEEAIDLVNVDRIID